ncbi:MAG: DUF222 domain-containing protein, partial [Acidimicrobiales bacterium]
MLRVADLLEAKLTAALGDFDSHKLWELDDRLSLKDWLRVHGRMTDLGAARLARLAQRLRDLPTTAAAWHNGTLSSGQVRVVTAPLTDRRRASFADHEDELIQRLATLDVTDTDTVMREWREAFDATHTTTAPDEPDRWLHHSRSLGDRGEGHFSLDAASAAILDAALAVAETPDTPDGPRMPSEKRADAFMDICRFYLDHHDRPAKRRHAPHVSLVVTPVQLEDGLAGRTMCGRTIAGP